jgi:hypothetical protein
MNFQIDSRIIGSHVTHVLSSGGWTELKKTKVIAVSEESNNLMVYLLCADGGVMKIDLILVKFILTN